MLLDATDPGFFGFGSGPDEKVFSVEALKLQLERDFGQCDELAMDFGPMTIATEGTLPGVPGTAPSLPRWEASVCGWMAG